MDEDLQSLSPTVKAVLEAYETNCDKFAALAAVVRELAERVAPADFQYDSGSLADGALEFEQGQECRNGVIRELLLAVSAELDSI